MSDTLPGAERIYLGYDHLEGRRFRLTSITRIVKKGDFYLTENWAENRIEQCQYNGVVERGYYDERIIAEEVLQKQSVTEPERVSDAQLEGFLRTSGGIYINDMLSMARELLALRAEHAQTRTDLAKLTYEFDMVTEQRDALRGEVTVLRQLWHLRAMS